MAKREDAVHNILEMNTISAEFPCRTFDGWADSLVADAMSLAGQTIKDYVKTPP